MIEYHLFWILYALASLFGWHEYQARDCRKLGENLKVETKYEGATCYRKEGNEWEIVK